MQNWLILNTAISSCFTARQDYFTLFEQSQSLSGAKTGDPQEKNTWPPTRRTWLVSHVSKARTHSGEMTSDLEC